MKRSGCLTSFLTLVVVGLLLLAGWTALALWWSYSEGERVGVLQKFSRKGWICKTDEGELALYVVAGVAPQIWSFSVRDPKVARDLNATLGERVRLHYTEHRGLPTTCFGETTYFVDRVAPVGTAAPTPGPLTIQP